MDLFKSKRSKDLILTKLTSFPELNPSPEMEIELNGTVTYINPAGDRLFPDIRETGLKHTYLANVQQIATEILQSDKTVHEREIQVDGKWYRQVLHIIKTEKRMRVYGIDITDRKQMEETLQESLANFRGYFENIAVGAAQIDTSGHFLRVNDRLCEITGYSRAELLGGMGPEDLNHPEDREADRMRIEEFFQGEVPYYKTEKRYVRKDGGVVWVHVTATPVRDARGRICYTAGIIEDITERKRLFEEVRESRARLDVELDAMTRLHKLGMRFVRDGNLEAVLGEIVDAAIAIAGADFGNIQLLELGTSGLKIVTQRGFPKWWVEYWDRVSEGQGACGTALERGERIIVEDVERSPIFIGTKALQTQLKAGVRAVQSTPLLSRAGRLIGMFSTHYRTPRRPDDQALRLLDLLARQAADIIEQTQAEKAIREDEERFRRLSEANIIGIITANMESIISANDEFLRMIGYSRKDLESGLIDWRRMTPPEFATLDQKAIEESMQKGWCTPFEKEYVRKDGSRVPILIGSSILTREPLVWVCFVLDLSAHKQIEEALRRSESLLRQTQQIMKMGGWEYDVAAKRLAWTEEVYRIYEVPSDYDPNNIEQDLSFYEKEHIPALKSAFERAVAYGESYDMELPFTTGKGRHIWVRTIGKAELREGRVVRVYGNIIDISDRKQGEEALKRANELSEMLIKERTAELVKVNEELTAEKEKLRTSHSRLLDLTSHLQLVREDERTHVALEIHDELGQRLTVLKMDLSWVMKNLPNSQGELFERVRNMSDSIEATIRTIKRICTELRPSLLDHLGIQAAIEWQIEEVQRKSGFEYNVSFDPEDISLNQKLATVIFRVFQESLTNVIRHAEATRVEVVLKKNADMIILTVSDNGKGITKDQMAKANSFGLLGIKERARSFGGSVKVEGIKGKGTTVTLSIPLTQSDEKV